jgi:hypothetical protein
MAEGDGWKKVARSSYWREDDARQVIAAWRRSGDNSLVAFCRSHGLSPSRLARWAARLRQEVEVASVPFHPVRLRDSVLASGDALVVELPGVATIRLPPGFAVDDLRRILSAFEDDAAC